MVPGDRQGLRAGGAGGGARRAGGGARRGWRSARRGRSRARRRRGRRGRACRRAGAPARRGARPAAAPAALVTAREFWSAAARETWPCAVAPAAHAPGRAGARQTCGARRAAGRGGCGGCAAGGQRRGRAGRGARRRARARAARRAPGSLTSREETRASPCWGLLRARGASAEPPATAGKPLVAAAQVADTHSMQPALPRDGSEHAAQCLGPPSGRACTHCAGRLCSRLCIWYLTLMPWAYPGAGGAAGRGGGGGGPGGGSRAARARRGSAGGGRPGRARAARPPAAAAAGAGGARRAGVRRAV